MKPTTLGSSGRKSMSKKVLVPFLALLVLAFIHLGQAQEPKIYRVGVVIEGGPYYGAVDGLKDGLRELGVIDGSTTFWKFAIYSKKGDWPPRQQQGAWNEKKSTSCTRWPRQ
jgi:hypothetical protein